MPIQFPSTNESWAAEMAAAQDSVGEGIIHDTENGAWVADSVQPEGMVESEVAPGLASRFAHGSISGKPMQKIADKFLNDVRPFVTTQEGVVETPAVFAGHRGAPFSLCYLGKNTFSFVGGTIARQANNQDASIVVPDKLFQVSKNAATAIGLVFAAQFVTVEGDGSEENPSYSYTQITAATLVELPLGVSLDEIQADQVAMRAPLSYQTSPGPGEELIVGNPNYSLIGVPFIPLAVVFTEPNWVAWQVSDVATIETLFTQQGDLSWW